MKVVLVVLLLAAGCSTTPAVNIDPAPTPRDLRWPEHVSVCIDANGDAVACMPMNEYADVQRELALAQGWIRQASYVLREECGVQFHQLNSLTIQTAAAPAAPAKLLPTLPAPPLPPAP